MYKQRPDQSISVAHKCFEKRLQTMLHSRKLDCDFSYQLKYSLVFFMLLISAGKRQEVKINLII